MDVKEEIRRKEELKRMRKETGLSQEKFAIEVGCSRSGLVAWEQGVNKINDVPWKTILLTYERLKPVEK